MKFLILLMYYNRPNLVRNALESIRRQTYQNYFLYVIDDGSESDCIKTVKELIPSGKFHYERINDSISDKQLRGGSMHGYYLNKAIWETESDIIIPLCDDDGLLLNYLENLKIYYGLNKSIMYAYSNVYTFNPYKEKMFDCKTNEIGFGEFHVPITPAGVLDSSMVTFRREVFIEGGVRYPYPQTKNLDETVFKQCYELYRHCRPTGLIGQYKAIYKQQLGWRENVYDYTDDKKI